MNNALITNVSRHPAQTLSSFEAMPARLQDECFNTLAQIAKIWARQGLRDRVYQLADASGLTVDQRVALRSACVRSSNFQQVH